MLFKLLKQAELCPSFEPHQGQSSTEDLLAIYPDDSVVQTTPRVCSHLPCSIGKSPSVYPLAASYTIDHISPAVTASIRKNRLFRS